MFRIKLHHHAVLVLLTLLCLMFSLSRSWCVRAIRPSRRWLASAVSDNPIETDNDDSVYRELTSVAQQLIRHDHLYYNSQPEVSDDEYDALVAKEAELCEKYPEVWKWYQTQSGLGTSATRYQGRVGALSQDTKRTHLVPMLSLDNVHSTQDLLDWLQRVRKKTNETVEIRTEPKLDGLSLCLRYQQGRLLWAATRGDGRQGTDVTHNVRRMDSIPSALPTNIVPADVLEVRGEVVLWNGDFDKLQTTESFSNARNAASGILLRKEQSDLVKKLRFYAYDVIYNESPMVENQRDFLQLAGFVLPGPIRSTTLPAKTENHPWNETDAKAMLEYYDGLLAHRENRTVDDGLEWADYDMDGCVHKVCDPALRHELGTSNRAPRWAVAHKFAPTVAVTSLENITVQVGRTGVLTPVAHLQPVVLGGVTIQRATLHNFVHMKSILGPEVDFIPSGTLVTVRRSGDVIPQVLSKVDQLPPPTKQPLPTDMSTISLLKPVTCPACGSPTEEQSLKESTGLLVRCGGPPLLCPPQAVGSIQHAFSRDALYIKGLSTKRIEHLMDFDFLKTPADIFELVENDSKMEEIAELEGWGERSCEALRTEVQAVARDGVSLSRFLYSLGIPLMGKHTSELVSNVYGTVAKFLADVDSAVAISDNDESFSNLREESELTKGIGPTLLASLDRFSNQSELVAAAKRLAKNIKVLDTRTEQTFVDSGNVGALSGSVVFTGSLPGYSRKDAQRLAKEMGASSTPSSISKNTGLVVIGDRGGGKKLEKARALQVPTVTSQEFLDLVKTHLSK